MPNSFLFYSRLLLGFCGIILLAYGSVVFATQLGMDFQMWGISHVIQNPTILIFFTVNTAVLGVVIWKIVGKLKKSD